MKAAACKENVDYTELLASVFEFMLAAGFRKTDIARAIADGMRRVEQQKVRSPRGRTQLLTAALILDAWHKKRRYLTSDAEPKAMRLFGPAPSVEALVRAEQPGADARALAQRLRALKLVVRVGPDRYKPTASEVVARDPDWIMRQHAARSCATLLGTIRHNVGKSRGGQKLIERFAEIPDLPVSLAPRFRSFVNAQGAVLLNTVNDWLHARRRQRRGRPGGPQARAGIHIFAYFEPQRRERTRGARATT